MWNLLECPALARRSTELVLEALAPRCSDSWRGRVGYGMIDLQIDPQCLWCDLYTQDEHRQPTSNGLVHGLDLEYLVESLPELESIRLDLRCTHYEHNTTRLGCDIKQAHCKGIEHLRTQLADELKTAGLTKPGRLPKPLRIEMFFHARGKVGKKPWECFACWTVDGGLQTDLEAARRCHFEVVRT